MSEEIKYTLIKSRRNRRVVLSIREGGRVVVSAPPRVSKRIIEDFVLSKADWIKEKIDSVVKNKTLNSGSRGEYNKYKARAKKLAVQKVREINKIYNFSYNKISIRVQSTRWGSCSSKKNLNFNYRILFLPDYLVDYLVAHELCHLREMNHSPKFWDLVGVAIPEYKKCRLELKKMK